MGSKLLYYLVILPISKLPFGILYLFSDFLFFIIYSVIAYRTKVVRSNLNNSFPNKSQKEILAIESKFYRHLCDLVVESLKAFSISKKEIKKRMVNKNPELIHQFHQKGKHVIMVGGHYGNWEMYGIEIGLDMIHEPIALFTPLKNQFMNEKITKSRSKYGLSMLMINDIKRRLDMEKSKLFAIIFASDQSPRKSQKAYWLTFLNQETGVQFGAEKLAKEYDAAVVFGNIYKTTRGFYEVRYQLICESAKETDYGFITKEHTRLLEKDIIARPEHWLWSHKRWKHKRPEGAVLN